MASELKTIQVLIEHFRRFPGIGPRQASRFAYALLDSDAKALRELAQAIAGLKSSITRCHECARAHEAPPETVCASCGSAENRVILVVEKDQDLEIIEKSGVYHGLYHILGEPINPLKKKSLAHERIKKLYSRVGKLVAGGKCEVIAALSANVEGDSTTLYLERVFEPLVKAGKITFTRLGRGLSTGSELEYADPQTLKHALENRK